MTHGARIAKEGTSGSVLTVQNTTSKPNNIGGRYTWPLNGPPALLFGVHSPVNRTHGSTK